MFSNEIFHHNEGIDKIKITLNPFLSLFNINMAKCYIDPHNYLTTGYNEYHNIRHYLSIHAEYIDLGESLRYTIAKAIFDCILAGFIELSGITLSYVYYNLEQFVWNIHELEIFFDVRRDAVSVDPSQKPLKFVGTSIYSPEWKIRTASGNYKKRDSLLILYDRAEHLIEQNQIPYDLINRHPYKMRFEIKMKTNNCRYLSLNNLDRLTAYDVIVDYLPYIAVKYRKWFMGAINFNVNDSENPFLCEMLKLSLSDRKRYTGDLEKAEDYDKQPFFGTYNPSKTVDMVLAAIPVPEDEASN